MMLLVLQNNITDTSCNAPTAHRLDDSTSDAPPVSGGNISNPANAYDGDQNTEARITAETLAWATLFLESFPDDGAPELRAKVEYKALLQATTTSTGVGRFAIWCRAKASDSYVACFAAVDPATAFPAAVKTLLEVDVTSLMGSNPASGFSFANTYADGATIPPFHRIHGSPHT